MKLFEPFPLPAWVVAMGVVAMVWAGLSIIGALVIFSQAWEAAR